MCQSFPTTGSIDGRFSEGNVVRHPKPCHEEEVRISLDLGSLKESYYLHHVGNVRVCLGFDGLGDWKLTPCNLSQDPNSIPIAYEELNHDVAFIILLNIQFQCTNRVVHSLGVHKPETHQQNMWNNLV